MKGFLPLLLLLLLLLSATSCGGDVNIGAFTKNDRIRLVVNGEDGFVYDENLCQLGFCRSRCEFRAFTDNMSDYFIVTLDCVPSSEGAEANANLKWSTSDSEMTKNNVAFNVVKVEGDKLWLWNNPSKTGAVVRVLE